jgi:hypothetical protein
VRASAPEEEMADARTSLARGVTRLLDPVLRRADLAVVARARLEQNDWNRAPQSPAPPLPQGAEAVLRPDHPMLADYERRYAGHPTAVPSQWSHDYIRNTIEMRSFRANNSYVWQQWDRADPFRYGLATYFTRLHDRLGLFDRLGEDGLFGAETYDIDGLLVSRDLLDSIGELTFLDDELEISKGDVTILDIGAGYGRLAHRTTTAFENVTYLCTDAVPLSTFLSSYYLEFRGVDDRARVIPLDRIEDALAGRKIDLAVNIHSFAECPVSAIGWWLDLLAASDVAHLLIVPNTKTRLLSKERDGPRIDFMPLVESAGFELVRTRAKYAGSDFMQEHGLHGAFPTYYFLFARRR